nr:clavesin-1-like [Onthophagus taurus]
MLEGFLPPINPKLVEEIAQKLNEDPERVSNNIKLLAEWIQYQQHLPKNYDPCILPSFLRGCKQNLDKAKKKIETFFIAKNTQLDIFGNISPTYEEDLSSYKYMDVAIIPELTPEGYRITIFTITNPNSSIYENFRALRYTSMLANMRTHHDIHQVAGEVIILDARLCVPNHVSKFLCNITRKYLDLVQTASPLMLKQIHIITTMGIVVKAVGIVKTFFKEKMRNRFYVWSNLDKLQDFIPLKCLPSDFGGELKTIKEYSDGCYKYVSNCDLFEKLDEMKLLGPIPKESTITFSNEDFGVDGSFRKLNVD